MCTGTFIEQHTTNVNILIKEIVLTLIRMVIHSRIPVLLSSYIRIANRSIKITIQNKRIRLQVNMLRLHSIVNIVDSLMLEMEIQSTIEKATSFR